MNNLVAFLTGLSAMVGVSAALMTNFVLLKRKVERLLIRPRDQMTIIGVPVGVVIPAILHNLPDYTSVKRAVSSGQAMVVCHFKNLEDALKESDWVVTTTTADPRVIFLDTRTGESTLLSVLNKGESCVE